MQGCSRPSPSSKPKPVTLRLILSTTERLASTGQINSFPICNCHFNSSVSGPQEVQFLKCDSCKQWQLIQWELPLKSVQKNHSTLVPHNCTACGHDQYELNILNPRLIRHSEGRKIHMRPVNQCSEFKGKSLYNQDYHAVKATCSFIMWDISVL